MVVPASFGGSRPKQGYLLDGQGGGNPVNLVSWSRQTYEPIVG